MIFEWYLGGIYIDMFLRERVIRKRESYIIRYEEIIENVVYFRIFKYFNINEG